MKVVDANVLLYAVNSDSEQHTAARTWLDAALAGHETVGFAWAVVLEGYFTTPVSWVERLAFCAVALVIIFAPTGHAWWWAGCAGFIGLVAWVLFLRPRALGIAS